jgi:hypothetical protein
MFLIPFKNTPNTDVEVPGIDANCNDNTHIKTYNIQNIRKMLFNLIVLIAIMAVAFAGHTKVRYIVI